MKPNRNDPCPCGSGKKYKHCCERNAVARPASPAAESNQLQMLFNAGRFAEVETTASGLLERYPEDPTAWKLLAMALHMQGKTALPAFQKTAELLPDDAGAQMNFGNVLHQTGQLSEAVESFQRALAIKPTFAEAHNNLGAVFAALGQLENAAASYRRAVQIKPNFAAAHSGLAGVLQALGQFEAAASSYRRAIQIQPDWVEAHNNLGVVLRSLGQFSPAIASYRQALQLQPNHAEVLCNLGVGLRDLGQLEEAVASFRQALTIQPDDAGTLGNLGLTLHDLGRFDEAITNYQHALAINPNNAEVHNYLGIALHLLGQYDKAVESCRRAIVLQPNLAAANINLGNSLDALELFNDAIESYRRALEIEPHSAVAHNNLGAIFQKLGQTEEALSCFREALTIQPDTFLYAIQLHLLLPVIPASVDAISAWRACYEEGLATLLKMAQSGAEIANEQLNSSSFYLAYHNSGDRPVMEALRHFYRICAPDLTFTAPHLTSWQPPGSRGQRIKVGFLSEFLTRHTIGSHYKGFIQHLDRSRFEVVVIHSPKAKHDAFRANLDALADKAIALPAKLKDQQQVVAAEQLDVLFYPDIGMSSATYFLAYSRLAPVQATSWGHPDTTGLDTMDYYVAATTNEAEGAQDNYTERLIRLNRLPCFYYKTPPATSPQLSKAELGLPESGTLYGCPQNLFKIHPDFDAVLADIVAGEAKSYVVLPEGLYPAWTELIKARWAATFPILLERVIFMPRTGWNRFMAVMSHMDVLLDPLHFGSGNTFYDAMVIGTPVVTWPGKFGRGRNVAAAYRQMGVANAPVAQRLEDYAPLALTLGCDAQQREALRQTLLAAAGKSLFEDMQAIREFESFLDDAVTSTAKKEKLADNWRA